MGGNNSRVLTLVDVVRVREWLLITLQNSFRIENERQSVDSKGPATMNSIQTFLLQTFQRFGASSRGFMEREAALVIAHDLTLDSKWTHDQIERFCELFAPEDGEYNNCNGGEHAYFNYRLFLRFVFFPIERQVSWLKLKACIAKVGHFEVYPGELVSCALSQGPGTEGSGVPVLAKKIALIPNGIINNNNNDGGDEQGVIARLREQVNCLQLFSHPNITRYHSVIVAQQAKSSALYLVEESHQSCTLRTILESFGAMKEPTIRRYLLQLLQALQFLHERDIAHGNLSTQTVNIDSYGLLKLSKFGISEHLNQLQPQLLEASSEPPNWTTKFPPPEATRAHTPGKKSDIWRVGILILQMANGFSNKESERIPVPPPLSSPPSPLRYGHAHSQQRSPQKRSTSLPVSSPQKKPLSPGPKSPSKASFTTPTLPTLPQTVSKSLRTLVRACLQCNPCKRSGVKQLIAMDFFQVDAAQATNEMLRALCTDLDASMNRLISSSSSSSSRASPNAKLRPFSGSGSPVRIPGRSTSVHAKYKSTVPRLRNTKANNPRARDT